jgi:hypothetical protein
MTNLAALAFVMVVAGCGPGASGPCAQRSGTYRLDFSERTGDCGPQSESIVTIAGEPVAPDSPCMGQILYSTDNCNVTEVNVACPDSAVAGSTLVTNGKTSWSTDGASGGGQTVITLIDASGVYLCSSSYDVTATRL